MTFKSYFHSPRPSFRPYSRLVFLGLLFLLALGPWLTACEDEIATGSNIQPEFSTDTLNLGTLLTESSSQTYQLMIYNRHSDDLRLSSVSLREGAASGFRMNVDGMSGTEFNNSNLLRIAAHDSMYLFVEATFPSAHTTPVTQHTAHIDVLCNGMTRSVVLTAQSREVIKLYGETLTTDRTFPHAAEVQIFDSLVIAEGVTLTLADSVTLYLHDKADLIVYGTLRAEGTPTSPVNLRGDRTDNMFDNLPYDNLPGQWGSLYIKESSRGNLLEHTFVRGMTDGIRIDSAAVDRFGLSSPRLTIRSSRIKNSSDALICAHSADMVIENSELSNAAGSLLELYGGAHDIIHCTLANYNFAAVIESAPVYFTNYDTLRQTAHPLYRCNFANTLIWSRLSGEKHSDVNINFKKIETENGEFYSEKYQIYYDSIFHYRFDHCLLHASGEDDDDFINIIWDKDPKFRLINPFNYSFDFRPDDGSPAIGAGATEYVTRCPIDLDGVARTPSMPPTIGCYEYTDVSPTPRNNLPPTSAGSRTLSPVFPK